MVASLTPMPPGTPLKSEIKDGTLTPLVAWYTEIFLPLLRSGRPLLMAAHLFRRVRQKGGGNLRSLLLESPRLTVAQLDDRKIFQIQISPLLDFLLLCYLT